MIERDLLGREYRRAAPVYFPAAKPEEASRSALKQLVRTFFNNSPGSAMAALLDVTEKPLSDAEYRRLDALLKRVRDLETSDDTHLDRAQGVAAAGAAAIAQALLARRASAATRHLMWTLAIAGLLLLPMLAPVLPGWTAVHLTAPSAPDAAPSSSRQRPPPPLLPRVTQSLRSNPRTLGTPDRSNARNPRTSTPTEPRPELGMVDRALAFSTWPACFCCWRVSAVNSGRFNGSHDAPRR